MKEEEFLNALRKQPDPVVMPPADGADKIRAAVRRRLTVRRIAGSVGIVAISIPVSLGIASQLTSGSEPSPGTPAATTSADPARTDRDSTQPVDVPADLATQLEDSGYIVRPAPGRVVPTVDEAKAMAASRASFISDARPGVAQLYFVTTPERGHLANPDDPQSAIVPLFDNDLVWVIVYNVQVADNAGPVRGEEGAPDDEAMVPATAVVFVDALTGKAERMVVF